MRVQKGEKKRHKQINLDHTCFLRKSGILVAHEEGMLKCYRHAELGTLRRVRFLYGFKTNKNRNVVNLGRYRQWQKASEETLLVRYNNSTKFVPTPNSGRVFTLKKQIFQKVAVKPQAKEGERNVQPNLFTNMYVWLGLHVNHISKYIKWYYFTM